MLDSEYPLKDVILRAFLAGKGLTPPCR